MNSKSNPSNFDWKNEWKNMPEYIQEKQLPYKMINIRFETKEDYEDFQLKINQKLTEKTKAIWYPKKEADDYSNLKYVNES